MELTAVVEVLGRIRYSPLTSPEGGAKLYEFVRRSGVDDVLELGFAHGTSSCYLAAALHEGGNGLVTAIDRTDAIKRDPNIHELLALTGLGNFVRPIFAERSYTWELMKIIEAQSRHGVTQPCFDFCFIDGGHTWNDDGFAFFLVDKLLRPGSWILFDDLHWRYADSPTMKDDASVRSLPEEEKATPQMMKVFSLLVFQHPGYSHHRVKQGWGWAWKKTAQNEEPPAADIIDSLHATPVEGIRRG